MDPMTIRPRVVFLTSVHHAYDPRILYREAATLSASGYDVHLVAQHPTDERVEGVSIHGVRALPNHGRDSRGLARPALHGRLIRAAERLLPDIVHFHDPELIPAAWILRRRTGCRVVYDRHEDYTSRRGLEGALLRGLERWIFRWVDHVIVAEEAYEEPLRTWGVPCTSVLNYFRPVEFQDLTVGEGMPPQWEIVYSGVQSLQRGGRVLVEVARRVKEAGLPWTIRLVGPCYRDRDRQVIDRMIVEAEVDTILQRVGWTRYVPYQELLAWTARAQVGLALLDPLPDYRQSLPTKFYEYVSLGLPFICSDIPLWKAFVGRWGCGMTADPADSRAVFDCLRSLYDDPDRYAGLQAAALSAAPEFAWDHMAKRLLEVYAKVTGREG